MSINALITAMTLESQKFSFENNGESMAEMESEIDELTNETNQMDVDLEQMDESIDSLESISASLESDLEEGGLSPQAAQYLSLAMESVMGSHRVIIAGGRSYSTEKNPVLSMESFGGSYTQEEATEVTLEGIKDTLKRAYQSVKNAAGRSVNATRELFGKLLKGTKALKATLEKQREQVEEYAPADGEVRIGSYGSRLHVGGQVDAKTVSTSVEGVNDIAEKLLKDYLLSATRLYRDLAKGLADLAKSPDTADDVEGDVKNNITEATEDLESLVKRYSKELPGGYQLVFNTNSGDQSRSGAKKVMGKSKGQKQYEVAGYSLSTMTVEKLDKGSRKYDTGQKVDAADKKTLMRILDNVEKIIDTIDGKQDDLDMLLSEREAALESGEKMIKAIKEEIGDSEKGMKASSKQLKSLLRVANKNAGRSITNFTTYTWKVARAALMYVNANLKAAGKEPVAVNESGS